jgi:YD repeat-containing protein
VVAQCELTGKAIVVDQMKSPYGAGWGIQGVSRLVPVCGGVVWVYGNGDWRYFAQNPDGSYTNPPEDFGTLVQNPDGSWTYTARDRTVTNFALDGLQTSVVDTHGLATSYTYASDGQGELTSVSAIDGGVTTIAGDVITEPGNRTWILEGAGAGSDLVELLAPTGQARTFTFTNHLLTQDNWDPLDSQFSYNADHLLTGYTLGSDSYLVTPVAAFGRGVGTYVTNAPHPADVMASILTPLGYPDKWTLTVAGEPLTHIRAEQREESWQREPAHEQVTLYTDWLCLQTQYSYDALGDLTLIVYPDGGVVSYQYNDSFGKPTQMTDQDGNSTEYAYNGTADLTQMTDADGGITSYAWDAGLLTETVDPDLNTITYEYDADRRVTFQLDEDRYGNIASEQSWTYDDAGNVQSWDDGASHLTLYVTNGVNEVISTTDGDGYVSTQTWLPAGLPSEAHDGRGITTDDAYTTRGLLQSESVSGPYGTGIETTTFAYDPDGMQTLVTDPLGYATKTFFDVDCRDIGVLDPRGFMSDTLYDDDSRVTETADNDRNITLNTYDTMARQLSEDVYDTGGVTLVTSHEWDYDRVGNVIDETDGDDNPTETTDGDNNVTFDLAAGVPEESGRRRTARFAAT